MTLTASKDAIFCNSVLGKGTGINSTTQRQHGGRAEVEEQRLRLLAAALKGSAWVASFVTHHDSSCCTAHRNL